VGGGYRRGEKRRAKLKIRYRCIINGIITVNVRRKRFVRLYNQWPRSHFDPQLFYTCFYNHAHRLRLEKLEVPDGRFASEAASGFWIQMAVSLLKPPHGGFRSGRPLQPALRFTIKGTQFSGFPCMAANFSILDSESAPTEIPRGS
jgi:hypothetical protein